MEVLWERPVFVEFQTIHSKLHRNCAFPKSFHSRKLGETTLFYAVTILLVETNLSDLKKKLLNLNTKGSSAFHDVKDCAHTRIFDDKLHFLCGGIFWRFFA